MNIIKLDKRHFVHKYGCTHGLRFYYNSPSAYRILLKLREMYDTGIYPFQSSTGTYWIGVTDISMLTMLILSGTK